MRQFISDTLPDSSGTLILRGRDFRHLVQVLRLSAGDALEVRFPGGELLSMTAESVDRQAKTAVLRRGGVEPESLAPALPKAGASMPAAASVPSGFPEILLFQWILKGPKMDQVLRQAAEAGVSLVVPVLGERCLASERGSVGREKTERWDRIIREARQQSGSPVATRAAPITAPEGIKALWQDALSGRPALPLVLTEAPLARKSLHQYLGSHPRVIALAIGPEGGMTPRELDLLGAAGFEAVHFRTNVLRAETAALYGIAAAQTLLLEFESWQPVE